MNCPKCLGELGRVFIHNVLVTVQLYADGAEQVGDMEWDASNYAHCSCGWEGTVGQLVEREAHR